MTLLPFFHIDAFANRPFEGNAACVMPMDEFLPDETLQAIAAENNVSETAFIVPAGDGVWQLRWFTPAVEVPLCGHATLATAHVLFHEIGYGGDQLTFETRTSGRLTVTRAQSGELEMDFPASPIEEIAVSDTIGQALGARPVRAWAGAFYAAEFDTPEDVLSLAPDMALLSQLGIQKAGWERGNFGCFALGGTDGADVTSRFFAPGSGIAEDPATGSWHCMLAPVIQARTGATHLKCRQAYPGRGAWIATRLMGDRVILTGTAVTLISGTFSL